MRVNPLWLWLSILPAMLVAASAPEAKWAPPEADLKQEAEMAFDHYAAARTEDQRIAIIDFLQHLDRKLVAGALIDHIVDSRNGAEATTFNKLVEAISPDGCAAVIDRLRTSSDAVAKGKLVVALRHCQGADAINALAHCLGDKRAVAFEAHGPHPRRVCDLAYDELFLKLRADAHYGLDPSPRMQGIITEHTPVKTRDAEIAKLQAVLSIPYTPAPSATPETGKPTTASISML